MPFPRERLKVSLPRETGVFQRYRSSCDQSYHSALVSSRAGSRDLLTKPSVAFGNAACSFLILKGVIWTAANRGRRGLYRHAALRVNCTDVKQARWLAFGVRPALFFILLLDAARCSVSAYRVHRAFPHALFDVASPLVPGNSGADVVRAGLLACSGDFWCVLPIASART